MLSASQWGGGKPAPKEGWSCFVAFAGFLAADTSSTVADFKNLGDITAAELGGGGDAYRWLLAGTSWFQHATGLETRVLGSSVDNVSHSSLRSK